MENSALIIAAIAVLVALLVYRNRSRKTEGCCGVAG